MSGVSLKKFAASETRKGPVCAVCQSPHRKELEAAYKSGIRYAVMVRWLSEEHGEIQTKNTLYAHFTRGHAK